MRYREFNFDGLVGPTHNYAGLSYGNIASSEYKSIVANPMEAALQGLAKARALAVRGVPQAVLPPHERPSLTTLRSWGFTGPDDAAILAQAARIAPQLLAAASSASAMWTANACTMTPSCDALDGLAHFTPANLLGNLHRSIESGFTHVLLKTIFGDPGYFVVHPPLSGGEAMSDEGAANHTRLWHPGSSHGLHLFVYGRRALDHTLPMPNRFPARQCMESCEAIARLHRIADSEVHFLQQSPEAIDAGVFHNDVISVGFADCFLYHESAFLKSPEAIAGLREAFETLTRRPLRAIRVTDDRLSLQEAVQTYLINSQLIAGPNESLLLVAPGECRDHPAVDALLREWKQDPANPVSDVLTFNLRESMRNGGGPACLRLRVHLSETEETALNGRLNLDDTLYSELVDWVKRHYRSELPPGDLADPCLLGESRRALDELTVILRLPPVYPFQLENS